MKPRATIGDTFRVNDGNFTRGGQDGVVVDVFTKGVALDFFCDVFGNRWGLPSIEFWEWDEIHCVSMQRVALNVERREQGGPPKYEVDSDMSSASIPPHGTPR